VQRTELSARAIEHFGSSGFVHTRVARAESIQVSLADLDGMIGGHEAASPQLLVVLAGRVVCTSADEVLELGVGEAVSWQEGEWHETRSLEKSRLLLIEGAFA
jgi:mannose-6-phosphate isomerase-like protein (cupin superfamily)